MDRLTFKNRDACGDMRKIEIECSPASSDYILAWYGAYFAGDDYTVLRNGRPLTVDQTANALQSLSTPARTPREQPQGRFPAPSFFTIPICRH